MMRSISVTVDIYMSLDGILVTYSATGGHRLTHIIYNFCVAFLQGQYNNVNKFFTRIFRKRRQLILNMNEGSFQFPTAVKSEFGSKTLKRRRMVYFVGI